MIVQLSPRSWVRIKNYNQHGMHTGQARMVVLNVGYALRMPCSRHATSLKTTRAANDLRCESADSACGMLW